MKVIRYNGIIRYRR